MRIQKHQLEVSASDLAKHLAYRHLTSLDLRVARGEIDGPLVVRQGFSMQDSQCRILNARKPSIFNSWMNRSESKGSTRQERRIGSKWASCSQVELYQSAVAAADLEK